MNRHFAYFTASLLLAGTALSGTAHARDYSDFTLGTNAENQPCRAVWRFESTHAPTAVDLYCGTWESPTGSLRLTPSASDAAQLLAKTCEGEGTLVASGADFEVRQVACRREAGNEGPTRFGLIARAGGQTAYGAAYPADWGPLVNAARVTLGLDAPGAAKPLAAQTPGMREIQAVYPDGPPGQGAGFNYELLRRRGYEQNIAWSFGASERDFSELLRAHQRLAPDDKSGEAEIFAEIAMNLSDGRRFEDAGELLDRAEAEATANNDALLLSKIANYRAIDQLNQGNAAAALKLALAANAARARMESEPPQAPPGGTVITPAASRTLENRTAARTSRSLLAMLEDLTPQERAQVLSAQGSAIAATATRTLGGTGAGALLDDALGHLAQSSVQPAWLAGQIYEERSALALSGGNARAALAEANEGLRRVRELAPETRIEARLMLAAERAQIALGDKAAGLLNGRTAVGILERQSEAPGMPADVASGHIEALLTEYERTNDPAIAAEYFETLTLVWDGAASRAAAQLAARLGDSKGGDAVKAYQDAQRAYRAALAKRIRISATEASAADIAKAEQAADLAARNLARVEGIVRERSPRYLELLNPKVSTADLAKVLGPSEGYLRVVLTQGGGYGALVTQGRAYPYRIALTSTQADKTVAALRASAVIKGRRLPDYDLAAARSLYKALFEPVEAQIDPLKLLHVDASGVLASVPMAALIVTDPSEEILERVALEQDYTGVDWFARRHAIDTALGPAAFVRTRQAGGAAPIPAVMAFGDFRPDPALAAQRIMSTHGLSERCRREVQNALASLKALPQTASEARQAAAAFGPGGQATLGGAFTDDGFMKASNVTDASVLVLATHGVLGLSSCFAEPALLTSVGPEGDGLIEASELLDRSLKARLVVLSACDTAGGGGASVEGMADAGEALSGLARAFIYAGAPSVLATEWKVDASASALQTDILLSTAARENRPVAEALGDAQRSLYEQPETAHPFFWSGFVLIGDGGAVLTAPGQKTASR